MPPAAPVTTTTAAHRDARQALEQVVDRDGAGPQHALARVGAVVGAEDALLEAAQRAVGRQRLLLEHVERGAAEVAGRERVDERAARRPAARARR